MEALKGKENIPSVYYIEPTTEELMKAIYSPGKFIGKCRICRQIIRGSTIEELKEHKCQS